MQKEDMNQATLAHVTGISEVSISRYINGKRLPNAQEIIKIAKKLHVTSDYLLGLEDAMNHDTEDMLSVKTILDYCRKSADEYQKFGEDALKNIGHGDSHTSAFGAVAWASEREDMFRFHIPAIIRSLHDQIKAQNTKTKKGESL